MDVQRVVKDGGTWLPFELPSSCLWVSRLFPSQNRCWGLQDLVGPNCPATEEAIPIPILPSPQRAALAPIIEERSQAKLGMGLWGPSGAAEAPAPSCG